MYIITKDTLPGRSYYTTAFKPLNKIVNVAKISELLEMHEREILESEFYPTVESGISNSYLAARDARQARF